MPKVSKTEKKKFNSTRWAHAEEQDLLRMRDVEKLSFHAIATQVFRKANAVERRYRKLKEDASVPNDLIWTDELDANIIASRLKGATVRETAASISLPQSCVQDRLAILRKTGKLPIIPTDKGKIQWTEEEDEVLLRMYIAMADEEEIHETANLVGKSLNSIRTRRQFHLRGSSAQPKPSIMYRKLLVEFAQPDCEWSKQDVLNRNFVFGSWKNVEEPAEALNVAKL